MQTMTWENGSIYDEDVALLPLANERVVVGTLITQIELGMCIEFVVLGSRDRGLILDDIWENVYCIGTNHVVEYRNLSG